MKVRVDKSEVIEKLQLKPFGTQGFYNNKNISCPFCENGEKKTSQKWGIVFTQDQSAIFNCFRCHTKTSIYNFLKRINRLDLIAFNYEKMSNDSQLKALIDEEEDESVELKKADFPLRLKRIEKDEYLDSRGFKKCHYDEFEPSATNSPLEPNLKNYIVFKIKMNGNPVAWLARSRHTKEWHEENLKEARKKRIKPKLRYENSRTDFTKILGGYDLLNENTKTVIIVEGMFDYINVENRLNLREDDLIRCCFTFGNSISKTQIKLMKEKGVKNIILMYDPDKPDQVKSAALLLSKTFRTTIAFIKDEKKDPGDADLNDLIEVLDNQIDPINFRILKKI